MPVLINTARVRVTGSDTTKKGCTGADTGARVRMAGTKKMHKSHGQVLTRVPVSPDTARVSSGTKFLDFGDFLAYFGHIALLGNDPTL